MEPDERCRFFGCPYEAEVLVTRLQPAILTKSRYCAHHGEHVLAKARSQGLEGAIQITPLSKDA